MVLADDVEAGWRELGPYFLHEMNSYGTWQAANNAASPYRPVADIDALRQRRDYAVLTPDEYVRELRAAPFAFGMLHPMCGGIPRMRHGRACDSSNTR